MSTTTWRSPGNARCLSPGVKTPVGWMGWSAASSRRPKVIQPDITKTLGISEGLVVGRRVLAAGKRLCFHMYGGPVGLIASAQLTAGLRGDWLEMDGNPNPLYDRVVATPPMVRDGCLILDGTPGLGVTLAPEYEDQLSRSPHDQEAQSAVPVLRPACASRNRLLRRQTGEDAEPGSPRRRRRHLRQCLLPLADLRAQSHVDADRAASSAQDCWTNDDFLASDQGDMAARDGGRWL